MITKLTCIFKGEEYLKQRGVEVVVIDHKECQVLMERFIKEKPAIWYEICGKNVTNIDKL